MNWYSKLKILSDEQMEKIHTTSLELLESKGVVFNSDKAITILKKNGAKIKDNVVFFNEEFVDNCLKTVPESFRVDAINPDKSVQIGGDFVIHPAGGEVFLKDSHNNRHTTVSIQDYSDLQKIYQACDNINMTGYQPLSPNDVPLEKRGQYCLLETMIYTDKPWLAPMDHVKGEDKRKQLRMFEIVYGKDWMRSHYLTWSIVTPESPLVFSEFSCESIIEFAEFNQPVALTSAPMTGITGPIHLLGTIVLANTETLAGLCLAQCVNPGVPVLPSASLTYGNMRLATWECASPDSAIMLAGAIQMYKDYYHLPARAQTGVTSSKCVDYQAGYEMMQSLLLTALMDVDVTSQSAGSLENLLTVSFEKTIIDDEIINRVRRIIGGIRFNEETISMDLIMDVGHGDSFLTHKSTLKNLRAGWQPLISDWNSYEVWKKAEPLDIEERAHKKTREIIDNARPLLEETTVKTLRNYIEKSEG